MAFNVQTDGQTKKQNRTIEFYLRAFVNYKQNNLAKLLLIAKLAYDNLKYAALATHILS